MDLTSIELKGCTIKAIKQQDETIHIRLEPAYLIKTMTGSEERTRWWQNIELVFKAAEWVEGQQLSLPATCAGGDIYANIYTYRDMVPVPLEAKGRTGCALKLEEQDGLIRIEAEAIELIQEDHPHYIEHIRPEK